MEHVIHLLSIRQYSTKQRKAMRLRCRSSQAAKSIFVIEEGSCFSRTGPSRLIFASSEFNSAPTSIAKPVQYNHTMSAIAAPSVPYVLLKFDNLRLRWDSQPKPDRLFQYVVRGRAA